MYKYRVETLPLAEDDIIQNTDYIAFDKKSPETALALARGFRKEIASLANSPQRHERDEDQELANYGVRKHYYKNYKIYYLIDEQERAVYILRLLHMLVDSRALLLRIFQD